MIAAYTQSLPPDRRPLPEHYTVLDTARKVAGVDAVGTRCYLSLLADADARSPLFLQLKEAMRAAAAPHADRSEFEHQGQRVVVGQRLMQAASDMFLGWTSYRGHDYYVRQYRDMKGSVNLDARRVKPDLSAILRRTDHTGDVVPGRRDQREGQISHSRGRGPGPCTPRADDGGRRTWRIRAAMTRTCW